MNKKLAWQNALILLVIIGAFLVKLYFDGEFDRYWPQEVQLEGRALMIYSDGQPAETLETIKMDMLYYPVSKRLEGSIQIGEMFSERLSVNFTEQIEWHGLKMRKGDVTNHSGLLANDGSGSWYWDWPQEVYANKDLDLFFLNNYAGEEPCIWVFAPDPAASLEAVHAFGDELADGLGDGFGILGGELAVGDHLVAAVDDGADDADIQQMNGVLVVDGVFAV